jgi:hypothetical protein
MKAIRLKIIDLLDKHSGSLYSCKGCITCTEIERLGKMLDRDPEKEERRTQKEESKVTKLTLEEYQDLKAQGLKDREIARKKFMNPSHVSMLKKKWNLPSKKPVVIEKPTPNKELPPNQETNSIIDKILPGPNTVEWLNTNKELRQLNNDLMNELKDKSLWIQKLQEEIQELKNLHAACEDVEAEVAHERKAKDWAQQEYARVLSELEQKDYELQNLLGKHADVYSSLIKLEKENKALKDLVKVWI